MNYLFDRINTEIALKDYVRWLWDWERRMRYHYPDRLTPRPKGQIAIARDFGLVLNDYGNLILLGHNDRFLPIDTHGERATKVAAAFAGYMVLTENGRIYTGGPAKEFDRHYSIESYSDVADVAASEGHTVILFRNGEVTVVDEPGGWEYVPEHNEIVKAWRNIKQVAVGFSNIMGLTKEGHVIYHSEDGHTNRHFYDYVADAVQIDCYSHYYGTDSSMVLRADGTVVSDTFDEVDTWQNIVQIAVGADIAVGLRRDGRLEVQCYRRINLDIKEWRDVVSVECKGFYVIGITKRGEILSTYAGNRMAK